MKQWWVKIEKQLQLWNTKICLDIQINSATLLLFQRMFHHAGPAMQINLHFTTAEWCMQVTTMVYSTMSMASIMHRLSLLCRADWRHVCMLAAGSVLWWCNRETPWWTLEWTEASQEDKYIFLITEEGCLFYSNHWNIELLPSWMSSLWLFFIKCTNLYKAFS